MAEIRARCLTESKFLSKVPQGLIGGYLMKIVHFLSAVAVAVTLGFAPARAEVLFTGSAAGCFGAGCSSFSSSAIDAGLTYTGSTFSGTTVDGLLFVGTGADSPNVNNFGSFFLSSTGNHDYS